jgi:hypothetical protein
MVTAEFAVALMALVPLLAALLTLIVAGAEQVRLVESARTAARMIARGQTAAEAQSQVHRTVPASSVEVVRRDEDVLVTVGRRIEPLGLLPAFTLRATAVTPAEQSDAG